MAEPTTAIPTGGDSEDLANLATVPKGGELNSGADSQETSDALTKLLQEATGEGNPGGDDAEAKAAAEKKAAEDKAAAEKKAAEDKAAADAAAAGGDDAEAKAAAEKKAAEDKAAAEKKAAAAPNDDLDKIELPPYTKPKAAEAFATVKTLAKQQIAAARKEAEELKVKLAETEKKVSDTGKVSPEVEKELKELREFRQKLDVEADPAFKEWDAKVKANEEGIYKKLIEAGLGKDVVEKIKGFGGPTEVDWEALNAKIPAPIRRYIEGKLFENETLAENKTLALAKAKENAGEYLKTRSEAFGAQTTEFTKTTLAEFNAIAPRIEWLMEKKAPANATKEQLAEIETHNAFIAKVQPDLKAAIEDNSPQTKAVLVLGFAQLLKQRAENAALVASHKAEVEKLNAELAEKVKLIEGIKKSSTSRLSSAPPPGQTTKAKVDINETASEALDRLRAEAEASAAN